MSLKKLKKIITFKEHFRTSKNYNYNSKKSEAKPWGKKTY